MNTQLKQSIDQALIDVKEGWCWPEKATAMAELIIEVRPSITVEIGIFGGRSLIPQALAIKSIDCGYIAGIDPWRMSASVEGETHGDNEAWWKDLDFVKIQQDFMDHLWRLGLEKDCIVIRSPAEACVQLFSPRSIDILHIDGNHSEEVSCRDVNWWLPKIKNDGFIWFDDTNWDSTQKALGILDKCCSVVKDVQSCRLYKFDKP